VYVLYSILLFLSLCIYTPIYYVRFKLLKKESLYLKERLGILIPEKAPQDRALWIHAVSVGEVLSLQNLIRRIKQTHPDWAVYFSTLTNTGMRIARETLKEADCIFFVPLDFKCIVQKFFRVLSPHVFITAESEFWPNLIRIAKKETGGVLLVNGRISPRSYRRYRKIRALARRILENVDFFLVQTEEDKKKLEDIGVGEERIEAAGNLKSELDLPELSHSEIDELKKSVNLSTEKRVVVAGSIRKGEEEQIISAFSKVRKNAPNRALILAPRHPERAGEVDKVCQKYSLTARRKTGIKPGQDWDVLILDTLGELSQFYALSDVAFVGGSLIPWGGHNLLEPAFYSKPIFFGPYMDNFSFLAETFVSSGAAKIIRGEEDLWNMFLYDNDDRLLEMGKLARETLNALQGATERTLKHIERMMEKV
jgi:3-deoxy-D-manno-octulosonic-acid transferase